MPMRLVATTLQLLLLDHLLLSTAVLAALQLPRSLSLENIEEDLANCVADPITNELLDSLFALDARDFGFGTWFLPTDVANEPRANNRPIPFLDALLGLKEGFEWFSNVIPVTYDTENPSRYNGLPPPPVSFTSSFPFIKIQQFPFFNFSWDTAAWGHQKFASLPRWVVAAIGNDPTTWTSSDLRNSIFSKNLEDRGPDNLLKRQYMSALTCDKLPFYEPRMQQAVDLFKADITAGGEPVLSSFFKRNLELFYDLHLGIPDGGHPDFLIEYTEIFTRLLAPGSDIFVATRRNDALRVSCLYPYIDAYFLERRQVIVEQEIESTFFYWWDKAGMPAETVVFEAVHNVIAWGQLGTALFTAIRAKLQGYVAIESLLDDPILDRKLDFFAKMEAATTENEKLDVAREVFRILTPSPVIVSQVETNGPNTNRGKALADEDFDATFTIILPLLVQVLNDNFDVSPLSLTSDFAKYDTSRYQDFQPASGCPFARGEVFDSGALEDAFTVSDVDGETVIPASHAEFFPVFPSGERPFLPFGKVNGPKYCPFGLGYRRCPAELFNLFYVQLLLDALGDLEFRVEGDADLFDVLDPLQDGFNDAEGFEQAVPFGLSRVRDNIYVAN